MGSSGVAVGVMLVGLIANVMIGARGPARPNQANGPVTATKPVDACFGQSYDGATADIKTATEVGSRASDMMSVICQDAVQKIGTRDCLGQCEAGFKYKAKSWVNRKP